MSVAGLAARRCVRVGLVGLLALVAWGCGSDSAGLGEGVVARIGDRDLAYADFESFLRESVGEGATGLENEVLAALFSRFLEEELLRGLAIERGLVHLSASRRRAVESLLETRTDLEVTDAEVRADYDRRLQDFRQPERVRLRQLLLEELETAQQIVGQLDQGLDFVEVARRLGDPGVLAELEQGELAREDLPPEFVETVFGLQPGETSGVLEADYGFHVFQVVERFDETLVPLERVSDDIRRRLETEKADAAVTALLAEARERYDVEIAAASLPFDLSTDSP